MERARPGSGRFDLEGVTHLVTGRPAAGGAARPGEPAGTALVVRNPGALPRARLMGRPVYVGRRGRGGRGARAAGGRGPRPPGGRGPRPPPAGRRRGRAGRPRSSATSPSASRSRPTRRAPPTWCWPTPSTPAGRPRSTAARRRSGRRTWPSAPSTCRAGRHAVVFTYRPAGFLAGLIASGCGVLAGDGPAGLAPSVGVARPGARDDGLAARLAALARRSRWWSSSWPRASRGAPGDAPRSTAAGRMASTASPGGRGSRPSEKSPGGGESGTKSRVRSGRPNSIPDFGILRSPWMCVVGRAGDCNPCGDRLDYGPSSVGIDVP